jgi:hypothetical protein
MMRACTGLHTDKAERKGFKEGLHLEPLSDQRPPLGICAVHLKDMLRGIGLTVATAMVESTGTAKRSSVTERATGGRRPSHRIGTNGQELIEVFATEAGQVLEAVAQAKRGEDIGILEVSGADPLPSASSTARGAPPGVPSALEVS